MAHGPTDPEHTDSSETRALLGPRPHEPVAARRRLAELERRLFDGPSEPLRLSRYVVGERIAEGGFAVVYAGHDPQLHRRVAIKLLHGRGATAAGDDEARARMLREAQAMARFSHPNVVAIHDVGTFDESFLATDAAGRGGGIYIVMEYVGGPTLAEWTKGAHRSVPEILEVFGAAGEGLAAAHDQRIVHRDFKPQNVIIGLDGRVRVADFGLARGVDEAKPDGDLAESESSVGTTLTRAGSIMGSPAYMAPEQHLGHTPDERADQFSFCVALFEALYGVRPFTGATEPTLRDAKIREHIVETRTGGGRDVPRWLDRVVRRGLRAAPGKRFVNMRALLRALESPSAKRAPRRVVWWAGAVVLAGGAVVAWSGLSGAPAGEPDASCAEVPRALEGLWDAQGRASVRSAFFATELPYAEDTLQRSERMLDVYTQAWVTRRTQVCEDSRTSPSSPFVLDRRLCLDRRLVELAATIRLFQDADARVVEGALERVEGLEGLASCEAAVAPSPDVRDRDRLDEIRYGQRMAQASALRFAGRLDAATEVVRGVAVDAAIAGDDLPQARARLLLGRVLADARDAEGAVEALRDALSLSQKTEQVQLGVAALAELALVEGLLRSRLDEAERLVGVAEEQLAAVGGSAQLRYRLTVNRAALAREAGHPRQALVHYQNALEILRGSPDMPGSESKARQRTTLTNMADTHTILGDYDSASAILEQLAVDFEADLGPLHPRVGRVFQSLGFVSSRRGDPSAGLGYARRALETEERLHGQHAPSVAWILNLIGACQIDLGQADEAVATHERALAILQGAQGDDDILTLRTRLNLGRARSAAADYPGASADVRQALRGLAEALGDEHMDLAYGYVTLGEIATAQGDAEAAREAFGHALRLRVKALGESHPQVVSIRDQIEALDTP